MTESDPQDAGTPEGEPADAVEPIVEPQTEEPAATGEVDLSAEAGKFAAKQPRSLDELGLEEESRTRVESYVSRKINDARDNWDAKRTQEAEQGKFMTQEQVATLLQERDLETDRREEARDAFVRNLAKEGISVGSQEYDTVAAYYARAVESGAITPAILQGENNIKVLIQLSGAIPAAEAGTLPGSGLPSKLPEGAVYADGSIQLNAPGGDGKLNLTQQVEAALIAKLKESS